LIAVSKLVVLERPADQRHLVQLTLRRGDQPGVPVAEVDGRVRGEQVEIPPARHVGHPGALGLADHHRQWMVVVRAVQFGLRSQGRRGAFVS
jgi:hypothetical protein